MNLYTSEDLISIQKVNTKLESEQNIATKICGLKKSVRAGTRNTFYFQYFAIVLFLFILADYDGKTTDAPASKNSS